MVTLISLIVMGARPASAQPVDYVLDQAHDDLHAREGIHSLVGYPTVTQEFTPTFGALNVVEIFTQDWSFPVTNGIGATLQVTIRNDTTNGAVLGVSAPLNLPDGWEGPSRFRFPELVWLTAGKRHAIEVRLIAGNNWGVESYGAFAPPYPGGRYFVGPHLVTDADMWFRLGVSPPAVKLGLGDARVIAWQGIPPLSYSVWWSTSLTNWSFAGAIQSAVNDYRFTNRVEGAAQQFFKVSFP